MLSEALWEAELRHVPCSGSLLRKSTQRFLNLAAHQNHLLTSNVTRPFPQASSVRNPKARAWESVTLMGRWGPTRGVAKEGLSRGHTDLGLEPGSASSM